MLSKPVVFRYSLAGGTEEGHAMVWARGMTSERLEEVLRASFDEVTRDPEWWRVAIDDFHLFVWVNEHKDRMRLMVPIAEARRGDHALLWVLLSANFDRAIEAKYAVHDGLVWCVFTHQLSWLGEEELIDALDAVVTLARNTGTTFASGELQFRLPVTDEVPEL